MDAPDHGQCNGRSVITFYLLAFMISWAGWVPLLAVAWGSVYFQDSLWKILLVLPATGPALAAWLASRRRGPAGQLRHRLAALFNRRVERKWLLVAIALPAALLGVSAEVGRQWMPVPQAVLLPWSATAAARFVLQSILTNPCEEIGWRGFALPRLQACYHPIVATLIVGFCGRCGICHCSCGRGVRCPAIRFCRGLRRSWANLSS